jgi:hypothetical protein
MSTRNMRGIIDGLKGLFTPKITPYGKIYDALREVEKSTSPLAPDETQEEWEARFLEEYGTRDQFITDRMMKEGN